MDPRRLLQLEPAAVGAAVAAAYAAGAMLYRAFVSHDGVFEADLVVAAGAAVWALYVRSKVTPVAMPKDNAGRLLRPAQQ